MYYEDRVVEEVRGASDIVDVIGRYVRLTRKGANYFGLCPFHGEKTASFSVSPQKQIYYCFGCGKGGDVIRFLMEYENQTFKEALESLAADAKITLPEPGDRKDPDSGRRARLLEIQKEAALFYNGILRTPEGRSGYEYLSGKRGLSDRTITHFGLGYSGRSPRALYDYLKGKGCTDEELAASGLVIIEEKGIHDRFWNRVMFPIMDAGSRVVGFGGRVLGDGLPKYLNSPETLIFNKSNILYGLNFARKSKRSQLLLCEGYMDVIALHQAGFTNAVASLGTAFNEKHATLLKRYTSEVVLTQDSDGAGIKAKLRAYPILKNAGLNVRILDMGDCKDPDEFIRSKGPGEYETRITGAKNAFMYQTEILRSGFDLSDPARKTLFYKELAASLCMFDEPLERKNYTEAVCREYLIPFDELQTMVEVTYAGQRVRRAPETHFDPDRVYLREQGIPEQRAFEAEKNEERRRQTREQVLVGGAGQGEPGAQTRTGQGSGGTAGITGTNSTNGMNGTAYGARFPEKRTADPGEKNRSEKERMGRTAAVLRAQRLLLSFLSSYPDLASELFSMVPPELFTQGVYRRIAEAICLAGAAFRPAVFMSDLKDDEETAALAGAILNADIEFMTGGELEGPELDKAVTEAARTILTADVERRIEACRDMRELKELTQRKQEIRTNVTFHTPERNTGFD